MSDLISRQALCEYALNQKDKSITPNDIMRFPSAQPKSSELKRDLSDCISRQEALDALSQCHKYCIDLFDSYHIDIEDAETKISQLPSAQPMRKRGEWIHKGCGCFECDQCGERITLNVYTAEKASERFRFCSMCGADMREGGEDA